ncbi:MAG TPA: replication-associated recombination protein A [Gammaproteobacteria bacterium]|jgi:putative ATPase|nr:replication-associated recombination protein A [Gammaproteobacteria bacterium]
MSNYEPLAETLRPNTLSGFVGQRHLLDPDRPIGKTLISAQLHSMILWGPSGTGKTTLARIMCNQVGAHFEQMSAVLGGVKELRVVLEHAKRYQRQNKSTILFVDEIHRFNKSQQDAFLPHIESGLVTLIGATTENPSFEINSSLLSRLSVYILKPLNDEELSAIASKALEYQSAKLEDEELLTRIIDASSGDARRLINIIEQLTQNSKKTLKKHDITKTLQQKMAAFDKGGDIYFQQLSAFHKSVRGSSPDGALYWMARMLVSGCDPKVIARRLLAIASEDIGNADPRALQITLNAWDVYERLGDKEGNRAIAQAAIFCACAPKSNAVYKAFNRAIKAAKSSADLEVPRHLCNASTKLMEDLNYGKGYRYAHDEPGAFSPGQTYFPDDMGEQVYYEPTDRGLEIKIAEKLKQLRSAL